MLSQKQKNIISYELYSSKKTHQQDYLSNVINKYKQLIRIDGIGNDPAYDENMKQILIEKRIKQIKKIHKFKKVSDPQPFIRRAWISPVEMEQKKLEVPFSKYRKNVYGENVVMSDEDKTRKVCNTLNINKKLRCFGQYLYSQFQGNESDTKVKNKVKNKKIDVMQKEYNKLMSTVKTVIVVCNKGSDWNKKIFINPLQQDRYYQKIMRKNNEQLMKLLVESLMVGNNFTFSSYIQFYQIFVWQQASKNLQVDFVTKILMKNGKNVSYKKLSEVIDFLCQKINLLDQNESLNGFNEVMKKLIFGGQYNNCQSTQLMMKKEELERNLQNNEECISIFINVFYCE